jgi:hypothetical protein
MDDPVILASGNVSHKLLPLLPAHQMNCSVFLPDVSVVFFITHILSIRQSVPKQANCSIH